jgi:hypothetical protein
MPVYDFGNQFTFTAEPRAAFGAFERAPIIPNDPIAVQQTSDASGRPAFEWEKDRVIAEDIDGFTEPGFRYLDEAMKAYWSDIRVPGSDMVRFVNTKIAGMSKSIEIWSEDLKHGRVKLPVISISRGDHTFNAEQFSPAYIAIARQYANPQFTRVREYFRPVPFKVSYTLTIWSEFKRDAEHTLYQIISRFNPICEFRTTDNHINGMVQLFMDSSRDSSDKEMPADQVAKIRYEVSMSTHAWLSLPTKTTATILGRVVMGEIVNNAFATTDIEELRRPLYG